MARQPISQETQTRVLLKCRRRCCICYGLSRDTGIKAGQIAHLDGNSANNEPDNLCFLCLVHHDEYDSTTSQRKNLTTREVREFLKELTADLGSAFSVPVHFGNVELPRSDPNAGTYIRLGTDDDSAEFSLTPVPDDETGQARYFLSGFALGGGGREFGPNMGSLSIVLALNEPNSLAGFNYPPWRDKDKTHSVEIRITDEIADFKEENHFGIYGMGVTFNGTYRKVR